MLDITDRNVARWLLSGERGLSSEAMVRYLSGTGHGRWGWDYPHDPDDFRRCQLLLQSCPSVAREFPRMAGASPVWAALVERWDDIHAAIEDQAPGYVSRFPRGASARKGYELMRDIIDDARNTAARPTREDPTDGSI